MRASALASGRVPHRCRAAPYRRRELLAEARLRAATGTLGAAWRLLDWGVVRAMISLSACPPDEHLLAQLSDPDGRSVVLPARIWDDKITITIAETVEASADTPGCPLAAASHRLSRGRHQGYETGTSGRPRAGAPDKAVTTGTALCRGFMARSAPGVDAGSGLGFPLWDIPL
jgi:hypothetical protein